MEDTERPCPLHSQSFCVFCGNQRMDRRVALKKDVDAMNCVPPGLIVAYCGRNAGNRVGDVRTWNLNMASVHHNKEVKACFIAIKMNLRFRGPVQDGRSVVYWNHFHGLGVPRKDEPRLAWHPLFPADGGVLASWMGTDFNCSPTERKELTEY